MVAQPPHSGYSYVGLCPQTPLEGRLDCRDPDGPPPGGACCPGCESPRERWWALCTLVPIFSRLYPSSVCNVDGVNPDGDVAVGRVLEVLLDKACELVEAVVEPHNPEKRVLEVRWEGVDQVENLVQGLGIRVWGLMFGVLGWGLGVWGLGFGVWGLRFEVWGWGVGFRLWGFGLWVWGLGFRV